MNNNQKYLYTYKISHAYVKIYRTTFFLCSGLKNVDGVCFCSTRNEKSIIEDPIHLRILQLAINLIKEALRKE